MQVLNEQQINAVAGGWEEARYEFFDEPDIFDMPNMPNMPNTDTRSWGILPLSAGDADGGEIVVIGTKNNGGDYCGSGWSSAFVPDRLYGVNISDACMMHDVRYSSTSDYSRAEADRLFLLDVYGLLRDAGVPVNYALSGATAYFYAVRQYGGAHYQGSGAPY